MIEMNEYVVRRTKLMEKLANNSIVIVPSAPEVYRNGDTTYPFRQNSDLYYLTGFNEPESILVLIRSKQSIESILFNRPRNRALEIWDGARAGNEGAINHFKMDHSFPYESFAEKLPELLLDRDQLHYTLGLHPALDEIILNVLTKLRSKIRAGIYPPIQIVDVAPSIHEMRLFKSSAEVNLMQKAVDISTIGHIQAMKVCCPGIYEYELEAQLTYSFVKNGAKYHAYSPIVGAGANSCVLHYTANNAEIKQEDLVLIDAGCEYKNYASDITRTFPANGKFSGEKKAIYELVLASQLQAIQTIQPESCWLDAQKAIVRTLTQGLVDLGILRGDPDQLIAEQAYLPFYMHKSGHWLGLDVHDVGRYMINNEWRKLKPGMTLTVEPGLYLSAEIPNLPARWHNIGVRIEDNVLVTDSGHQVLSHAIPKSIDDIESCMLS